MLDPSWTAAIVDDDPFLLKPVDQKEKKLTGFRGGIYGYFTDEDPDAGVPVGNMDFQVYRIKTETACSCAKHSQWLSGNIISGTLEHSVLINRDESEDLEWFAYDDERARHFDINVCDITSVFYCKQGKYIALQSKDKGKIMIGFRRLRTVARFILQLEVTFGVPSIIEQNDQILRKEWKLMNAPVIGNDRDNNAVGTERQLQKRK